MKKVLKVQNNTNNIFAYGLLVLLAIVFQIIVFYNYFIIGIHKWHIKQPEVIQGGTELLIFFALIAIGIYFIKNNLLVNLLIVFLSSIYLELHHVLISTLTALVYFEIIILFGNNLSKLLKLKNKQSFNNYIASFLIGISIYLLIFLSMSILGFGTILYSRILIAFFIIFSLLFGLKFGFKRPFTVFIFNKFNSQNFIQKLISLLLFFLFLTAAAKGIYIDYDSIWYSLRSEYVLIGQNSFFDKLGMYEWVNFYPKLVEIFQLPLSGLKSYSFINNSNAIVLIFIIGIIIRFFKELKVEYTLALLFTLSISTIPFIVSFAALAKHDIFTTFLMLAAVYFAYLFINSQEVDKLIVCFISIFLSFGGKLTSGGYMPPLILTLIITIIYWLRFDKKIFSLFTQNLKQLNKKYYILLFSSFLVLLITCIRTFILTGYPFFPFMQSFFNKLGFSGKYPFNGQDGIVVESSFLMNLKIGFEDFFIHWYHILFNPTYGHLIFSWFSNIYFYISVFILAIILISKLNHKSKLKLGYNGTFWFKVLLFVFYLLIFFIFNLFLPANNNIDGNYFMLPIIFIMIFLLYIIDLLIKKEYVQKKIFIICLIIFIPLNTIIMFTTSFTWHQGTEAFSFDLLKPIYYKDDLKKYEFEYLGIEDVESYILENNKNNDKRACFISHGDVRTIFKLDCRIGGISYLPKTISKDPDHFCEYLETSDIDYLIFDNEMLNQDFFAKVYNKYSQNPNNCMIKTEKYTFIDRSYEK